MIVQRSFVQSATLVMPSSFHTSTEFTSILRVYGGSKFCIIPISSFTPNLTIERKGGKFIITATSVANSQKVYDVKITKAKINQLPGGYVFHFNLDGQVVGVSQGGKGLSFKDTWMVVGKTKLQIAPHILSNTKTDFIGALLKQVLEEEKSESVARVGFYVGDHPIAHTNEMALVGIVAAIIPLNSGVRIKGIYKHAPDYAETVFWFELKQCAPDIYEVLKDEDLKSNFMEYLDKCL